MTKVNNKNYQKLNIMTFLEKLNLIERIDQLIRLKATGSTSDLANRLGVARSTVYEIIETMKSMGAEIKYCRIRRSFYYTKEVVLSIGFADENKIKGGQSLNLTYLSEKIGQTRYNFAVENIFEGKSLNPPTIVAH